MPLDIDKLSGAFIRTSATQQTIAAIKDKPAPYFMKHLLGRPLKFRERARNSRINLIYNLAVIIRDLQPTKFEVLIDLIFSNSGWKRDGDLGGNIKFTDVTLLLPSTNEKAGVQVKTASEKKKSQSYVDVDYRSQGYDKFFYVYHTGHATN
ncbi:hypothetical protein N9M50_03010 [Alphaproteobacteria bacterium]|nr:hypothetical protein [Alphaproteobacteria bacterium]